VNWPDPSRKWVGEPVSFLSVQVGYPDTQGALQWDGHVFEPGEGSDAKWTTAMAKKNQNDVANAPAGWTPDKTFLKRKVHFAEPPSELENPYVRISVERNEVELDLGPNGSLISDINNEVRVDNVGALNVGPMFLGVDLEGPKQIVEVTFKAEGKTLDGHERVPVKLTWSSTDQVEPRYWMIFTGQPDFQPKYSYQVRVMVKGSIMTHGMEWIGPWVDAGGNGPLMVRVPTLEDPGVTVVSRTIVPRNAVFGAAAALPVAASSGSGYPAGTPPASSTPSAPGRPPSRGVATGSGAGTPPSGSKPNGNQPAADDPFNVPGFAPRDTPRADRQYLYTSDPEPGNGSRGMGGAPAGVPPSGPSAPAGSRAMTAGGYSIGDDGPAR
jgi:hypothetical protein